MKSECRPGVLVLTAVLCLVGFCGCGSSGNSISTGGTPKTNQNSSQEEVPGPQTEPPLAEPKESPRTVGPSPTTETVIAVQVVDRAGFDSLLAKHKGKVVLVDYWATWCAPCRKKFPHTVALANQYKADGLAVISVSMDDEDNHADVVQFLSAQGATFDNLRSGQGASDESFEAFEIPGGALPCLRLYDRESQLLKTFAIDPDADKQFTDEEVAEAVKSALKE